MVAGVLGPAERGGLVDGIGNIEAGAARGEQADGFEVTGEGSLVERGGMGVVAGGIVAIGVFAAIEQEFDDGGVAVLGGEGEGTVASFGVRLGEEDGDLREEAEAGGGGEVGNLGAAGEEGFGGGEEAEGEGGEEGGVPGGIDGRIGAGAVIDEGVEKGDLEAGLGGRGAGDEEGEGGPFAAVAGGKGVGIGTGLEESDGDGGGVGRGALAIAFDAVGAEVVEEGSAMDGGLEMGDAGGASVDEGGVGGEEGLQCGEMAGDQGVDGSFKRAGLGGGEGGKGVPIAEIVPTGEGFAGGGRGQIRESGQGLAVVGVQGSGGGEGLDYRGARDHLVRV